MAKAVGRGMTGGPLNLIIQKIAVETGEVSLALTGELVRQLPAYADMIFTARTKCEDNHVFAISLV